MMEYWEKLYNGFKKKRMLHILYNSIQYRRHLFWVKRKEIKELCMEDKVYYTLKKDYFPVEIPPIAGDSHPNDKVWVCWLQGFENAPDLVKVCISRMYDRFGDSLVLITSANYKDYVTIPEYIVDKWKKGYIENAHFSDILRVFLICEHGGTWIDSTVLILDQKIPAYFLNSKMFVFSNLKRNSLINISSWYISAWSHHPILELTKYMLVEYWREENYTKHYFLFHLFFSMACGVYPQEWDSVPKFSNIQPHILSSEINKDYSEERLQQIANMCPIQKLSNKMVVDSKKNSFYYHLIKKATCQYE